MNRRQFLKVVGISTAAAAVEGCTSRSGAGDLIPYPVSSDTIKPGVSTEFATVCRECPAGCGMIVRTRDGRANKADGNPDHPVSGGKLCLRGQSSLQGLYHPERIRQPLARDNNGQLAPISWDDAMRRFVAAVDQARGKSVAWIGPVETGAFDRLVDEWLGAVAPTHTRLYYEPYAYEPLRAAAGTVLGRDIVPEVRIDLAHNILCFGADFLETWVSNVEYARQFGAWRRARQAGTHHGRYVFIGPRLSMTGANADEWIAVRPGDEEKVARAITALVQGGGAAGEASALADAAGVPIAALQRIAREFAAGPSLALPPGEAQHYGNAVAAHEAVLRLNQAAGAVGTTLIVDSPHALSKAARHRDVTGLISTMQGGGVGLALIHRANPAYNLPPSAGFREALAKVPMVVSFSSMPDETTELATLVLPDNYFLESWGEYSPRPGVTGILQPVMTPVFDTRPTGDVLLASAAKLGRDLKAHTFQEYLRKSHAVDDNTWNAMLQRGMLGAATGNAATAAARAATPAAAPATTAAAPAATSTTAPNASSGFTLHLYPSIQFYDGRTADRTWAQEIPEPMSKAVWGSWVEIHPDSAKSLGAANGDVLLLQTDAGQVQVPALVTDRVVPGVLAIMRGQGRETSANKAEIVGINPLALLPTTLDATSGALVVSGIDVNVKRLPVQRPPIVLQTGFRQVGSIMAQGLTLTKYLWDRRKGTDKQVDLEEKRGRKNPSLYAKRQPHQHHWGLAIDLDTCIGCNACVASCYAENNVPIVGALECSRGREMAWLRIENYVETDSPGTEGLLQIQTKKAPPPATGPRPVDIRFLPMLCQQCNNAPCEYVCPVDATVHSPEGLNQQVYNRCVGTRYCSNNCPYKVRRFNWYTPRFEFPLHQQLNPDVTVRTKGVMEKCTFCAQRIEDTKVRAKAEKRPIRDGELQTACQQACPTNAIIFGDMMDPNSQVAKLSQQARGYGALEELNTYPNITYLARLRAE